MTPNPTLASLCWMWLRKECERWPLELNCSATIPHQLLLAQNGSSGSAACVFPSRQLSCQVKHTSAPCKVVVMLPIQARIAGAKSTSLNICMRYKRRFYAPLLDHKLHHARLSHPALLSHNYTWPGKTTHGQARPVQRDANAVCCRCLGMREHLIAGYPKGLHRCTWVHKRIGAALEASSACSGALPAQLRTSCVAWACMKLHTRLAQPPGVKPVDIYAFSCLCSSCKPFQSCYQHDCQIGL